MRREICNKSRQISLRIIKGKKYIAPGSASASLELYDWFMRREENELLIKLQLFTSFFLGHNLKTAFLIAAPTAASAPFLPIDMIPASPPVGRGYQLRVQKGLSFNSRQ